MAPPRIGPATRGFAILRGDVTDAANTAAEAERLGYHVAWSPEFYTRSAIVSLAAMAQVTSTARIGSSIAYAVGRTPLVLATGSATGSLAIRCSALATTTTWSGRPSPRARPRRAATPGSSRSPGW